MTDWKRMAESLWGLLDDISALDDACKSDDSAFRVAANKVAERRLEWLKSMDGHTLVVSHDAAVEAQAAGGEVNNGTR